ncbi:MAG TPA: YlzJ-like family protein [Mobilitalea sp.]|nr:YlzJ-like family protein [Mobilitalea sp.]
MLYTVRPLERIYAAPGVFDQTKKGAPTAAADNEPEYREVLLPNGRIVTRRDGENYVIERVNSTDMLDYLKDEYVPGKSYRDMK